MPTDQIGLPSGIVAVIRAPTADEALVIALGLARAGIVSLEITLTVPGALDVIAALKKQTTASVGAGTVLSPADAAAVVDAGAEFLVSPVTDPAVIDVARRLGVPFVAGALTPTEARAAMQSGSTAVKIFPVGALGGPAYVRALLEPMPDLCLVVSGGISLPEVAEHLAAGARAVCLGSALINRSAAMAGDVVAVAEHARSALAQLPVS